MTREEQLRKDFEEWWGEGVDEYGTAFRTWKAAAEKYAPRWLPIETLPDEKETFIFLVKDGSHLIGSRSMIGIWMNTRGLVGWMPLPPAELES